jgi:hypothetical protein
MVRSKRRGSAGITTTSRRKRSKLGKHRTAATPEHMNMLLRLGEQYNTSYDFEASEWFWSKLHKDEIPSNVEEFENKYPPAAVQNFSYLKGSPQSMNYRDYLSNMDFLTRICIMIDTVECKQNGNELNPSSME